MRKTVFIHYNGTADLSLDPKEFQGCSVAEIECELRNMVRGKIGPFCEPLAADISAAAMAIASPE